MREKMRRFWAMVVALAIMAGMCSPLAPVLYVEAAEKAPFYFQKSFNISHQYSTPLMGTGRVWASTIAHKMIHRESGKAMYCVYPGHASGQDSDYVASQKAVGMYGELSKADKVLCSKYAYIGEQWGAAENNQEGHVVYMAVQALIWDVIRTGAKSSYKNTVRKYNAPVTKMMKQVKEAAEKLTDTNLKLGAVLGSSSEDAARKKIIGLGKTAETVTLEVKQGDLSLYEYISINGEKTVSFREGERATAGKATFIHEKDALTVQIPLTDKDVYVIKLMKTEDEKEGTFVEDYLAATDGTNQPYQLPCQFGDSGPQFFALRRGSETKPGQIILPRFQIEVRKLDAEPGYDGDDTTPQGDGSLNAVFKASGTINGGKAIAEIEPTEAAASHWGTDVSFVFRPWESESDLDFAETELTQVWTGTARIQIQETAAGTGYLTETEGGTGTDKREYNVVYTVSRSRADKKDPWPEEYTYSLNGRTLTDFDEETILMQDVTGLEEAVFRDKVKTGNLQIVKTKDDLNPFSPNGDGVQDYSTKSLWTLQLLSGGSQNNPYVKVREAANPVSPFFHCYEVVRDGSGTPANEQNPLSVGEFGQILVTGLPYGEYLVTEIQADSEGYVLEYFVVNVTEEGQNLSTEVNNVPKENVITVVKEDSETRKTIPASGVAFRVRYMGNPSQTNPEASTNYGRLLPNGSNYTDGYQYVFLTDANGRITLPYQLEYGNYQLEEFLAPEGYYIGAYDETGESAPTDGTLGFYETVAIYDAQGNKVDYRKSDSGLTYNYYAFSVTEQKKDETVELVVHMTDNAVKGKIQLLKTGEVMTGVQERQVNGYKVTEPVYEQRPLAGARFQILAREDVELSDGTIPPVPYDAATDQPLDYTVVRSDHSMDKEAEELQVAETVGDSEISFWKETVISEENISITSYKTEPIHPSAYHLQGSYISGNGWSGKEDRRINPVLTYDMNTELEYGGEGRMKTRLAVSQRSEARAEKKGDRLSLAERTMALSDLPGLMEVYSTDGDRIEIKSDTFADGNSIEVTALQETIVSDAVAVVPRALTWLKPELKEGLQPEEEGLTANISNLPVLPEGYEYEDAYEGKEYAIGLKATNGTTSAYVLIDQKSGAVVLLSGDKTDADQYYDPADWQGETGKLPEDSIYQLDRTPESCPVGFTMMQREECYMCQDGDGNYRILAWDNGNDAPESERTRMVWVTCDEQGRSYTRCERTAELTLNQSISSDNGWQIKLPDYYCYRTEQDQKEQKLSHETWNYMTVTADGTKDSAKAIVFCWEEPVQVLDDAIWGTGTAAAGCEIQNNRLEEGMNVVSLFQEPEAPEYFLLEDGTRISGVYSGEQMKSLITVDADAELPALIYQGQEIDWIDGVNPDHPVRKVTLGGGKSWFVTNYFVNESGKEFYTLKLGTMEPDSEDTFQVQFADGTLMKAVVLGEEERGCLTMEGIYRTMRYPKGTVIEEIESDENGIATSSELPLGEYYICEIQAPEGYVRTEEPYYVSLEYKDQYTPLIWTSAQVENPLVDVNLELYKVFQSGAGSDIYEPGEGAVFGIFTKQEITADLPADTMVAAVVTDKEGKVTQTLKLPEGDYYAREIQAPEGYRLNDQTFYFHAGEASKVKALYFCYEEAGILGTIIHRGQGMADLQIETLKRVPAISMKVNGIFYDTEKELEEGTLGNGVLVKNRIQTDRSVFTITGSLYEPVRVQLDNGSGIQLEIDEQTYEVVFTDSEDDKVKLNAGEATGIQLTEDGLTTAVQYSQEITYTGYEVISEMDPEEYCSELLSAAGTKAAFFWDKEAGVLKARISYPAVMDANQIQFDGEAETGTGITWKKEVGEILVNTDQNREILLGEDTVRITQETDSSGKQCHKLQLLGESVQGSSEDGYQADGLQIATVTGGKVLIQKSRELQVRSSYGKAKLSALLQPDHSFAIVRPEGEMAGLWLNRASQPLESDQKTFCLLPGNECTVLFADGSILSACLQADGHMELRSCGIVNGVLPEAAAAPGTMLNGYAENLLHSGGEIILQTFPMDAITVDEIRIRANQNVTLARSDSAVSAIQIILNAESLKNRPIQPAGIRNELINVPEVPSTISNPEIKLAVSKADPSGKMVAGARLTLTDEQGMVIRRWVSGLEPEYFEQLKPGRYHVKEEEAPAGYKMASDLEFELKEDGKTVHIVMTDEPILGRIRIRKTDSEGKPLKGAVFEIKNKRTGELVDQLTSDKNGEAVSVLLPAGQYEGTTLIGFEEYMVKEIGAPEGYVCSEEEITVTFEHVKGEEPMADVKIINEKLPVQAAEIESELPKTGVEEDPYPMGGLLFSVFCILYLGKKRKKLQESL